MKKGILFVFAAMIALSGCGSSGSGSSEPKESIDSVKVSGVGTSTTVSNPNVRSDVSVTSVSSTINILSDVRMLSISGTSNLINIASGVSIEKCELTGVSNTAIKAENVSMSCTDKGVGNEGF